MKDTPTPVEAYKYQKCDLEKMWSFEEAQEHEDIEVDTPLPRGLFYADHSDDGHHVFIVLDDGRINQRHAYTHTVLRPAWYTFEERFVDSRDFKEKLRQGTYSLVRTVRGSRIRGLLGMAGLKDFIKIPSELEEIVRQKHAEVAV